MKLKSDFGAFRTVMAFLCFVCSMAFASGTVLNITETELSFNHTKDNYSSTSNGTRFCFKAPKAGSYIIKFSTVSGKDELYYYGSDNSFSSYSAHKVLYSGYIENFGITATSAGEEFYFRIEPYTSSYYSDTRKVVAKDGAKVTFENLKADNASSDSVYLAGDTVSIYAPGDKDHKFSKWKVSSGTCTIGDATKATTTLAVNGNCKVTAEFTDAVMYKITTTPVEYSPAANYYSGSATNGVRFYLIAPKSGGYRVTVSPKNNDRFYFNRYVTSTFATTPWYNYSSYDMSDSMLVSAGDTLFYKVSSYYTSDSNKTFSISYSTIKTNTISLTSASANCSTAVALDTALPGQIVSYTGYSKVGYRPNGWKVLTGDKKLYDSTAYTISDTINTDTKYQLQCIAGKYYDITSQKKGYTFINDFYDRSPEYGIRFRYTALSAGIYAIRATSKSYSHYFNDYGNDSTATSYKRRNSFSYSSPVTQYIKVNAGDKFFYTLTSNYSSYFSDSVYIVAKKAALIQSPNKSYPDTVALGDTLTVTANTAQDTRFGGWYVEYGSGKFLDSTSMTAKFIPSSDSIKINFHVDSAKVYTISSKESTFDYFKYGSKSYKYGVRTVFVAPDTGTYALVTNTNQTTYVYKYSYNTFGSNYKDYDYAYSGTSKIMFNMSNVGDSLYFLISPYSITVNDSFKVKVLKTVKVRGDTAGYGYVYVGTNSRNYDSTYVSGDSILLRAYSRNTSKFSHWERVSGSCTISDSTLSTTYARLKGDCNVRAVFVDGIIYNITQTPTAYTVDKHYYIDNYNSEVRFRFVAPKTGIYIIAATREVSSSYYENTLYLYRYSSSSFSSYTASRNKANVVVDSISVNAGDTVYYKFQNYSSSYARNLPFWISYSSADKGSITVLSDIRGHVTPDTGYASAWLNVAYPISASADSGYRFNKWRVLSGNANIADTLAKNTVISTKDSAKVKATYKKGTIETLTTKEQKFSFMHNYFSDYTGSSIYFKWTAPDTSWRMISFVFSESISGTLYFYGNDSTFSNSVSYSTITSNFQKGFQPGKKGETQYWKFVSSTTNNFSNAEFSALVATPYVLTVNSPSKGYTNPAGDVALAPGMDTLIYAIPYGGYTFDSWVTRKGSVTIDNKNSSRTRMKPTTAQCIVEATYSLDFTVQPKLTINSLDLNNHPGVCATVSVVDENSGRAIPGLDSTDFVLHQDKKSVPIQISSVEKIGGVSVVLVVDESGSMGSTKMTSAKNSIRQFINEMGPYDRTAIVGFENTIRVHQAMTSDRDALLNAVNNLSARGGTYINDGISKGLDQLVGETNATAVIVFSDGYDASDDERKTSSVVAQANGMNTTIYSIAVECDSEEPLKTLAESTGGSFTMAPSADQLADIYASIRSAVQARYVLCYNSPDAVLDGDTHQVVIKGTFLNKVSRDTAYWDESFLPPVVTLTDSTKRLIGYQQSEGVAITIKVIVKSKKNIGSVYIYTKTSDLKNTPMVSHAMTQVKDSLWSYTIPASSVVAPGIDFYVVATDVDGLVGKSPSVPNPAKEPYTIPVKNNVPKITSLVEACIDTTNGKGIFDFQVSDTDGINQVILYYKNDIGVVFETQNFMQDRGDKNLWFAEIPTSYFVDSEVEFYVRALDNKGASARWNKFKNASVPACKDGKTIREVKDSIALVNVSNKNEAIARETEVISATLTTEDFSRGVDTVLVNLSCLVSGDMEENLKMVETSSGKYKLLNDMKKDERNAKRNDGRLSCTAADTIVVSYKDPMFGTTVADSAAISSMEGIEYRFMDSKCYEDLDSVLTSSTAPFCLVINMESPTLDKADTLDVILFTNTGDTLKVKAVETGKYTSEFKVKNAYFTYVSEKKAQKDTVLDAVLNFDGESNRIKIQAEVKSDKSNLKTRDYLIVNSDYVGAELAELYDSDLDGQADSIRIHYKKAITAKIESIDTLYWNKAGDEWRSVKKSEIVLESDNKWIHAKLEKPFEYGKTAIDTSAKPYLQLTKSKGDIMQKMFIEDHIGAVPVEAVKHPGEMTISEYLDASDKLPPDTLVITLSEPIKNVGDSAAWKKLFRYSKSCSDTATHSINAEAPTIDSTGTVWTFVLKDYNISVDNCIRTNPAANYVDRSKNPMGRGGIDVTGKDGSVYLYEVAGNPAISGLGKKAKWIPEKGDQWEVQPDTISSVRFQTIAPFHAFITIYDGLSHIVTSFQKDFGHKGEMEQEIRGNDKNHYKVGFLKWNQRSSDGRKVGTGVYIWRIDFKFEDGHAEYRILQTGVKR